MTLTARAQACPPLVAITGPTGAGKSALALAFAKELDGEILNCDSVQVYRYFDIGSAKLAPAERQGIPHHLLDLADPDQPFTAGDFGRLARAVAAEVAGRGKVPVVVGGTGFYLRAMLDGLAEAPPRDEELRQRLAARDQRRPGSLARILARLDPPTARRIHPHDRNKLIRALEICLLGKRPATETFAGGAEGLRGFRTFIYGLDPPRAELYEVLNQRCRKMFESGLIDEVRSILARGFPATVKPLSALGYKQVLSFLEGNLSYEAALESMQKETRNYAKRQWTWFKKDTRVSWIPGFGHSPQVQQKALETFRHDSLSR